MLRPAGVLALITYGVLRVDDALDAVVQHFYRDVIGPYWPPERQHVDSGYRNLPFPFVDMAYPPMAIEVSWTLPEFIGYVDTWSAVRAAEKMVGRAPIDAFAEQLAAAWGERDRRRTVQWPLSLRITRL